MPNDNHTNPTDQPPPEPTPETPAPQPHQTPSAAFIQTAKSLGPVVGALAILSLTLPGALGTILLGVAVFNAGTPANFYDPDAPNHHRLLGTWNTTIPTNNNNTPNDTPNNTETLRLSLLPSDTNPNTTTNAAPTTTIRAIPLNIDPPEQTTRADWPTWQPIPATPNATTIDLEPLDPSLPNISLNLQPAEAPANDTATGTYLPPTNTTPQTFTAERRVPLIQSWIIDLGPETAAIAVALLFAAATGSALLPTYALSFAVGVFFGPVYGAFIALFGVTAGSLVGYTWGALLARNRVSQVIDNNPRAHTVRAAIIHKPLPQETFAVALLRFPPNSPFALTNLAMSSVGVRLLPYTIGTAVGIAPRTLFAVYLGVAVANIADAQTAGGSLRIIIGLAIGIAVFIAAYKLLSKWAKDALAAETAGKLDPASAQADPATPPPPSSPPATSH